MQVVEKSDSEAGAVKRRALSGLKALTLRTVASQGLRLVSSLCLARLLFPSDYGVFGVAAYLTGLGMFLGDVGLSAALVRQQHAPSDDETFTVFCCHQLLTATVVATILLTAPWLVHLYHLSPSATLLLSAMALGLFFSSLRIVPMMMLERQLKFAAVARCEMTENIAQTASTILLAYLGCGAWALAGGGLIRGAVGLTCIWLASPWRPKGRFRLRIAKGLAGFGLSFQLNAVVPRIVAGWIPLIVGRFLGTAALGLVNWAINLASLPLMLSAVLNRIAFPAYSRLQDNPEFLAHSLQSSVRRLSAVLWVAVPLFVIACPVLIPAVFGRRWTPAVPLVQWFSIECVFLTMTGLLAATQNASGRASERLYVTLAVGGMRWCAGYLAVRHFGLVGIGGAMCGVSLLELILTAYLVRRRHADCSGLPAEVFRPALTAGIVAAVSLGIASAVRPPSATLFAGAALAIFTALIVVREVMTDGRPLFREWRAIFLMLFPAYGGELSP